VTDGRVQSGALHVHSFGDVGAAQIACLHGVTSWGGHFAPLADRLADRRVLAPDLLGHGSSPREPPWRIDDHLASVVASLGEDVPRIWLGHSFGGRLALAHAASHPNEVDRLVLLDPAIHLPGHVALWAAENARAERRYATFDEAIDRRFDESQVHRAPRALVADELRGHLVEEDGWRYRYTQAAVVTAYAEMATKPPPFEAARIPTLLVLGADSYLPYDHLLDAHREALGELLEVVVVPGGHTVLWDALDETANAISRFIA
jgi:lipase